MGQPLRVGVIGLGNMGSALARALLDSGHEVMVWNRSPDPVEGLRAAGAVAAADAAALVGSSDVIVLCLAGYGMGMDLLRGASDSLQGRTVVQLTSGTPDQAVAAAAWLDDAGATFVEGMIMCLPEHVGTDNCRMVYSAPAEAFAGIAMITEALGGTQLHISDSFGAATGLGLVVLGFFYVCSESFIVLAAFAGTLGISPATVFQELAAQQSVITEFMAAASTEIGEELHISDSLSVRRGAENLPMVVETMRSRGIDPAFVQAASQHLHDAIAAGYAAGPISSIAHTLKDR